MKVFCNLVLFAVMFAAPAMGANSIQTENAKAGTTAWKITNEGGLTRAVEGYTDLTSVNRGGRIRFYVHTNASASVTMEIFRWGYYGGTQARKMLQVTFQSRPQPACPIVEEATKLVECNWSESYALNIPASADPTDWMSGVYLVKLTESATGKQQYIRPFAVREDARFSDIILPLAINTDAAYNPWGGYSLYGDIVHRGDFAYAASKVSLNRPYYGDNHGAGHFFSWESDMITLLEKEGYDVTYATNVDMEDPNLLVNHKSYMCVGHDEYWTREMRLSVEAARDRGVNLNFFCANSVYWQVRYENSQLTNQSKRTLVGYKDDWREDPVTPDYLKTNYFRRAPVNWPEDSLLGVMFVTMARPVGVVEDASHWAFTNTGLKNGDIVTNPDGTPCFGYEVDSMGPGSPANAQRLMHSPANSREANFGDMTIYRAPSGATVFASGSISWCHRHPGMVQLLRNVLARSINGAFADAEPIRPALPAPFQARDIGNVGRPGFVALAGSNSFTLNGAGQDGFSGSGDDAFYYVYQQLSGDGQITVRLKSLQLFWNNRAGVMIRESLAANARFVALVGRPSESAGAVNEGAEFRVKSAVGGSATRVASQDSRLPNWLRLVRSGNTFTSYLSADGSSWSVVGSATLALPSTAYIGVAVASAQYKVWASASFDNVSVSGGSTPPPTDITKPTVSITSPASNSTVSGTVAISASASDNVGVAGVQFMLNGSIAIGPEDTASPYSASWSTAGASNGAYTITAIARDGAGNTASSTVTVNVSSGTATPAPLPSGWSSGDVGTATPAGSTAYSNGTFAVKGSGDDIWNAADAFQFAYTQLAGDGRIVARVASVTSQHAWVKAGVMIRKSLTSGSAHGLMLVSYSKGVSFQRRIADGGLSASTTVAGITAPRWVRLDRAGNTLSAYQSSDGTNWTFVGSDTIPMGPQVYIGLAVTSHLQGSLATGTFDSVTVSAMAPPTDTTRPSVSITSPPSNSTVSGSVAVSASASDNAGVSGVQFKLDGSNLGTEDASSPYSIVWDTTQVANGSHTITATARDAAGNTSTSTVAVNVSNPEVTPPTGGQCSSVTLKDRNGNPPFLYSGVGEANWTLFVTAPTSTCTWTVTRNQSWTWLNGSSTLNSVTGTGSGTFALKVVTNTTGAFRTGSITLNGVNYTIKQEER